MGLAKLKILSFKFGLKLGETIKNRNESEVGNLPIKWAEGIYTVSLDYFCDKLKLTF